ncbi:hypothetical protein DY000_02027376 [Brassica cretica]|uniref:Uncharacterized protein n=1 Tax=Brassica cretica TaxID=69181 RepID=A0ABQ7EJ08_BRACR|nr:hypothetical protein DY000_02027376 [Brassica cretica]
MDTGQTGSQLASAGTKEEMRRIPADDGDRMKKKCSLGAVFNQIQINHQIDVSRRKYNREEEAIRDNRGETIERRICRKRQSNITGIISVISRRQTPLEFDAESKAGRLSPEEKG